MKTIFAKDFSTVDLGRRGENFARQILFDLTAWQEAYGDGSASLLAQLPEQSTPYPCATTRDGNRLIWKISAADTSIAGKGKCELCYYVGDQLVKSVIFHTFIADSLAEPGPAPAPYTTWVDEVFKAKDDAIGAKEAIENMSVSAEMLPENATPSVTKSTAEDTLHLLFRLPSGPKGEKGEKGEKGDTGSTGEKGAAGITPVRGVDYFTPEDYAYFDAHIDERLGEVGDALDALHAHAQALVAGGDEA